MVSKSAGSNFSKAKMRRNSGKEKPVPSTSSPRRSHSGKASQSPATLEQRTGSVNFRALACFNWGADPFHSLWRRRQSSTPWPSQARARTSKVSERVCLMPSKST